ncbi:Zinc finger C3HC-like [Arabidopsis thaliana x Arabidopsis arenosa]|uniref:ILP1 n=2 Tax=Arabidopsis TaxID=3701 RepID=A0A178WKM9_ARATH|nr:Zinc finger C3HC-like [Arabidopsis thaliana x Arabidopsis arenosa]OAP18766.1 ILP1 [Arabidopsis thaliana]
MKEEDVSSQNVNPRSNRNSVASASASASATPVDRFRRRARSPSPPQTAAASSAGASSPAVLVNAGSVDWSGHGLALSVRSCRTWDRGDLLRRLATFKPSNWLGKPKTASSLACAQKGWVSVDLDKLQCEYCGSILQYSPPEDSLNPLEADTTGEKFSKQLDDAHESSCPWVGKSCSESLVQFPPTPPSALIGGYKDRCDGLLQFYSLPIVSPSAIDQMRASRRPQIDRLLAHANDDLSFRMDNISAAETSKEEALSNYSRAQKLISLCGWEPRWLPNIQDCEEHSAQSARNGCPSGPARNQSRLQDPGPSRKQFSASSRKASGNYEVLGPEYKSESRIPLLDCSLCGVTVRICDFMTTSRPVPFAAINANLPETSKKMGVTHGTSATSGINGWFANEGMGQQQNEDVDEAETSVKRRLVSNVGLSFYQNAAGASSSAQLNMSVTRDNYQFSDRGKEVLWRQPSGSEVGDRAASYESRGPSTRKRSLDDGGSTVDRPYLRIQRADSVEGTVVDRDGDEVNDDSAGPSKRTRGSDVHEAYPFLYGRDLSVGGPSHSLDAENEREVNRSDPFSEGNEQVMAFPGARDSTRASSVIAMDTICHSANDDSMESVENHPGDFDDINYPSVATAQSADFNDPSELNFSNQAQQSACFQPAPVRFNAEQGISSINDGEEVLNTETVTAQGRDGPSLGVSGGSVGMGASHEAEIHGADVSVHRGDSVVGDMEPVAEVIENLGQSGEFAPDQGLTDDFVPAEMDREGRLGDSQDRVSQSVVRADSGSKIVDSLKAESVESGEKMSNINVLINDDSVHPSLSCNAIVCSGYEASKEEVTQTWESPLNAGFALPGSSYTANDQGPQNGDSNDDIVEFDPIKYHNCYCPWVNENVAAAGCSSNSSGSSGCAEAVCGWQLTLDALDSFQSLENPQNQTMESESAASLCKDDHRTPSQKLLKRHSFISSHGKK